MPEKQTDKPKLSCATNYDIFEKHEFNRELHDSSELMASMQKHGFMPSSAIHCVRNGNGKLKVKRGHHRLHCAKRLGIPVWYIVDETDVEIFELETPKSQWSAADFAYAHAQSGDRDVAEVLQFQRRYGLSLSTAASLIGGEGAGSNNKVGSIKAGRFKAAADTTRAYVIGELVEFCRDNGISFATRQTFVSALFMCVMVPEFDVAIFKRRVSQNPGVMRQRTSTYDYLSEIDSQYNYGAKSNRLNLAFKARELSRARQAAPFGKANGNGHAR